MAALSASGWPIAYPVLAEPAIEAMAARIAACHDGPLVPIGFSMGGIVALALARMIPERIAGIGLIDTNAGRDLPERAAVRPRQQQEVRAGALERVVVEEMKPAYLADAHRGDRQMLDLLRDMALGLGPDLFVAQSEALRTRPDLHGVLAELDAPVFVACGGEDRLCPPDWHARLAAEARGAELHVIPGAGHMLPLERPLELAGRLGFWMHRVKRRIACPTTF